MSVRRQENEYVAAANDMVLRLLSIDDDPAILALVKEVFECEPVEVFVAGNASEGLELVRNIRPHVVLLDVVMPEIDGMQMLKRILEIDPGLDVILMTGNYSME